VASDAGGTAQIGFDPPTTPRGCRRHVGDGCHGVNRFPLSHALRLPFLVICPLRSGLSAWHRSLFDILLLFKCTVFVPVLTPPVAFLRVQNPHRTVFLDSPPVLSASSALSILHPRSAPWTLLSCPCVASLTCLLHTNILKTRSSSYRTLEESSPLPRAGNTISSFGVFNDWS